MEKWLLIIESNCSDPSREKDFNDWYDNIHLPDAMEPPGVMRAMRYENTAPNERQGKYLTMFEIESDNIDRTMAAFRENVLKKREQGRVSDLVAAVSSSMCRQITAPIEKK